VEEYRRLGLSGRVHPYPAVERKRKKKDCFEGFGRPEGKKRKCRNRGRNNRANHIIRIKHRGNTKANEGGGEDCSRGGEPKD